MAVVDVPVGPATKKSKVAMTVPLTASNVAVASSSSGQFSFGAAAQQTPSVGIGPDGTNEEHHPVDQEEEFVCAIRPADASFPHARDSQLFSSLLSTASIVAHDLDSRPDNPDLPAQQPYSVTYPPTSSLSHEASHATSLPQASATASATDQSQTPPTLGLRNQGASASNPYQQYGPLSSQAGVVARSRAGSDTYLGDVSNSEDQPL